MKKIMFDDRYGLTQAVLKGRKTMTRRIITDPDIIQSLDEIEEDGEMNGSDAQILVDNRATYKPGEVVAVAQRYSQIEREINTQGLPLNIKDEYRRSKGFANKMYVRADLMPHQIRITNVRVGRLQDISEEDCLREGLREAQRGFFTVGDGHVAVGRGFMRTSLFSSPRKAFAALINKMYGLYLWQSNPWVFVYEFELVK